jgi:hypothetical protein
MFASDDPIAVALDWGAPMMNDEEYDKRLAGFLGDLACGESGSPAVAEGLARRATGSFDEVPRPRGEPDRLLTWLLAARLTPDDPADCPAAEQLPEDLRAELRALAARLDQPPVE